MVVDLVVPESSLVTIAPREVLGADVLVGVLDALLKRRKVVPVLPVFIPEVVRVDTGKDQGRNNSVDRQLAPELARGSSMVTRLLSGTTRSTTTTRTRPHKHLAIGHCFQ